MRPSKGALALVVIAALAAMAAGPARALELSAVSWTISKTGPVEPKEPIPIELLPLDSGARLGGRLTAKLALRNQGPRKEGILIRYSLSAKLAPVGGAGQAVWALPFLNDERRVPQVGPDQTLQVPVDVTALTEIYLKRVRADGYWPVEFKLEAMLEPREGAPIRVVESSLPVAQTGPRARH